VTFPPASGNLAIQRQVSQKILNLNGVRYRTIYHGVTRDGRAHIVEFKPGVDKSRPHQKRYSGSSSGIAHGGCAADLPVDNLHQRFSGFRELALERLTTDSA